MATPFINQRKQLAIKIETTEGTDAVPSDVDVVAPVYDLEYTPNIEQNIRDNVQASLSRIKQVSGQQAATMTFSLELKGSGTAGTVPTHLSDALQACGMGETIVGATSVTYNPISADDKTVTLEMRIGDASTNFKSFKILGARGTFSLVATKGQIVLVEFEFTGVYVEPTDTTAFTTPSDGQDPETFLSASFEFQTETTLKISQCTLEIGNEVTLRNDVNKAAGHISAVIVNRQPIGSIDPEEELISTVNFWSQWTTDAEGELKYILGTTAGNITTISAPKAEIINIAPGDRDGLLIDTLDLQLNQSVDAGEDELSIAFT